MERIRKLVKEALIDNGIMKDGWKFEIVENARGYEYITLEVLVYKPRCKKPETAWFVPYSTFRNILYWHDAECVYNRYFDK